MNEPMLKHFEPNLSRPEMSSGYTDISPGALLAAQRRKLGWNVDYVSNIMKLAPRQIEALEADNYAALPGIATVKGFVRGYAKILKMDPEPLLATLSAKLAPEPPPVLSSEVAEPTSNKKHWPDWRESHSNDKLKWIGLAGAIIVLLLVAKGIDHSPSALDAGYTTNQTATPAATPDSAPTDAQTTTNHLPAPTLRNSPQLSDTTIAQIPSAPATAPASTAATPTAPATLLPTTPTAPATLSPATPAPIAAAPALASSTLVLTVSENSWVEIRADSGKVIFSRLIPAGSVESIPIAEPARAIVGNVQGVQASFRGAPLELPTKPGGNVARFELK